MKVRHENKTITIEPNPHHPQFFKAMVYWDGSNGKGRNNFNSEAEALEWAKEVKPCPSWSATWEQVTCNGRFSCD